MVALPLSFLGVHFWVLVKSAEYQPAVIICLLMSLFFVAWEKKGERWLVSLSVISGVLISFFDFLTTETMTILIPMALVLLVRQEEGRLGSWKENIPLLLRTMVAWGAAYAMTFGVKWTLASLILGENKFVSAFSSAAVHFSGTEGEDTLPLLTQIPFAILANISTLFGGVSRVDFLHVVLGLIPYIRYGVLNNHSYLHEFFTYRAQAVSILAVLALLWYNTDKGLLPGRNKSTKKKKKR